MRIVRAVALGVALAIGAVATGRAEHPFGLNENHPYGIISNAYETPHVRWARPYAGGEVKALVMAPMWSQRETVELAQRLSLDYTAWMSETFREMNAPAASDQAAAFFQPPPAVVHRHLRQCLAADYDVIVVGKLDWAMLPGQQRLQLLEKVAEGTGLVHVGPPADNRELEIVFGGREAPEGREFIATPVPLTALPAFKDRTPEDIVKTSMFGQGRVVVLDYGDALPEKSGEGLPCLTPQWDMSDSKDGWVGPDQTPEIELVPYEYYQALVVRAVLWAAAKTPRIGIAQVGLARVVPWPPSSSRAQVVLSGEAGGATYRAVVRSRRDQDRVYDIAPRPADARTALPLPDIPAGDYFLDVWLMTADATDVMDWHSKAFSVVADVTIDRMTIEGRRHEVGDAIRGHAALSRALGDDERLTAELWDNHGRKVRESRPRVTGTGIGFTFDGFQPLTILHRARLVLSRRAVDMAVAEATFPIRLQAGRDDFNEVTWAGAENQFLTFAMLRKLATQDQSTAIDVGWRGATNARNVAAANLAALPYTARFGCFGSYTDHVIPATAGAYGCMSSPVTLEAVDEWGATNSDIYGPYGPLAWTHGDETYHASDPNVCWCETCLAALREYLREVYPDLAALNAEWGAAHADWSEVMPITYEQAVETGNYAPWIEHRLAQQLVFARFYEHTGKALSTNDPGARAGFDGPQALPLPNGAINWWVLKDHVGILQDYMYNSESMEILRSFAEPSHLTGMWYGTYGLTWQLGPNTVAFHHSFPWYTLFHGLNSTWFWTMGAPGPLSGHAPDLTNLPFFDASRQALREIRAGVFTLLRTGRRANDGIAVHYSEVSRIADSLFSETRRSRAWMEALADVNHAVEDCGLQYEYVAREQIEQGALQDSDFRVLIMPHSRAVSEAEATAIRAFVHRGGLLIADIMPGTLNGHGSRQERSMLADLFPAVEPGVVNAIGRGKAVLLGDTLAGYGYASYRGMQGWRRLEGRGRTLAALLQEHGGVTPQVDISHRGPGEMPPTEITRFVAGDAEFAGLLRKYYYYDNEPYPVTIRFPDTRHVYDVRAGRYLGLIDSLTTEISYEAHLYARLPYRVEAVAVEAPAQADRAGPTTVRMGLRTSGDAPGPGHAFDVRVLAPGGEEMAWYARQTAAVNGAAEVGIPWALNDAPGTYTVVVREAASGVTARREVTLP